MNRFALIAMFLALANASPQRIDSTTLTDSFSGTVNCDVMIKLVYDEACEDTPILHCSSSCQNTDASVFSHGRIFKRFDSLEKDFDLMVEIIYSKSKISSCQLVPFGTDEDLNDVQVDCLTTPIPTTTTTTTTTTTPTPTTTTTTTPQPTTTTTTTTTLAPRVCPDGWFLSDVSDHCYYLGESSATWSAAKDRCTLYGGSLASVHSAAEQQFISGKISESVWIGLNDITEEGTFQWIDASHVNFNSWVESQPDNGGWLGSENCVAMTDNSNHKWTDYRCESSLNYLCKRDADILPIQDCPTGWISHSSRCYFVSSTSTDYTDARQICSLLQYGSKMALPKNLEDDQYLMALAGGEVWIDLNDSNEEGNFVDADGNSPAYTNWYIGEPNNLFGEDCTQLDEDGTWNDEDCENHYNYICEISKY